MHADEDRLNALSGVVIGCAFAVLNTLGAGFVEKVYANDPTHELRQARLAVRQRHPITVLYDSQTAGKSVADLLVELTFLVEQMTAKALPQTDRQWPILHPSSSACICVHP